MARGLILAAPASGSGKTTLTLALLRALVHRGIAVASAKVGPDYIDPAFHAAATGRCCVNIDSWAMRAGTLARVIADAAQGADLLLVEGVMGLFDGAIGPGASGDGSTADLAVLTDWPVVLVVDAGGMGRSAAALLHGFATFRPELPLAGVLFNRVGGPGHHRLLRAAAAETGIPVLGLVPRDERLVLPRRHLGLVQATELPDRDSWLDRAAAIIDAAVDLDRLGAIARPVADRGGPAEPVGPAIRPPGQRIAIARDDAFRFFYPHIAAAWRDAGAELSFFSPLADQDPDPAGDAVVLPGGYPELYAGILAGHQRFHNGLRAAADRGAAVLGECGGYMVLGRGLIDAQGQRHAMTGLLPIETSFAAPRLQLGYRRAVALQATALGPVGTVWRGHEFHYASLLDTGDAPPNWLDVADAEGKPRPQRAGHRAGTVAGSFLHFIDQA
ncbi:MAG: cobyrinate a,c-diamide synthase [Azospirillaceae bacterium]|nr:cobyrinate a,c-diamide synthase [Azospirillaceae bacterium]